MESEPNVERFIDSLIIKKKVEQNINKNEKYAASNFQGEDDQTLFI